MKKGNQKAVMMFAIISVLLTLAACGGNQNNNSKNEGAPSGNSEAKKVTEVNLSIPTLYDMTDSEEVEAEINKIAEEKYGVHINLGFVAVGNWQQQSNLLLTGDEADVIAIFQTPLTAYVKNGQLEPLSTYFENTSEDFKNVWTEEQLKGTSVDGTIYAIPNLRGFGGQFGLNIDSEIAEEFGIQPLQKLTMEDIDEFLKKVHEKYPERYVLAPNTGYTMTNGWAWDGLGDNKYIGVLPNRGQDTKVQNLFETKDFKDFCNWTRKWYTQGYIMADVMSNTEAGRQLIANKKAVSCFDNFTVNKIDGITRTLVVEAWTPANSYAEIGYGINSNSKHKDAAWTVLQLLYTDKEIGGLLGNGIEGKHFIKNEDGTVSYPDGKTAANVGYPMADIYWITPYAANSYPLKSNGATFFQDLINFNNNTLKSKAYGFSFDTSSVVDQYSACSNVMDKYYGALLAGVVDIEPTIEQANNEFKAAGLNDIITEKQTQLDKFLAQ